MTVFDELAETDCDNEFKAWVSKAIDTKQEIVAFAASQVGGSSAELDSYLKGSFNLSFVVRFGDRRKVLILNYLRERTTIPVPQVLSWGMTEDSPQQLGPFIIMDFMPGTSLELFLKKPTKTKQEEVILAENVDGEKLDYIYKQLADYMLQLSQLDFSAIGAISRKPSSNEWTASERPFTYNMNELASVVSNYPISGFPAAPFTSAKAFLYSLADEHLVHLRTQRNLVTSREDAKRRFIARHRFKQSVDRYCLADTGPFKPYCDDLRIANMLADPKLLRITAVLDFEFSNTLPVQFAYDPPWWLLLLGPDMWLERYTMEAFVAHYVPRMEQFLRAMKRVEARARAKAEGSHNTVLLSTRMRGSWDSGRFWFDYGIRKSFDVDAIYWAALHRPGDDVLDKETREEMEQFADMKMEQLKAYDAECKAQNA
ncbi:phosphotransferase enzyme family protein-like protein [Lophium mytilinum]|uniref:Phosphotransferase enzyme family protein-like protein n=1 Tax=Lophium mytilinum TaxID=390894 RepID=A0A6A6QP79_9PEZI|nr:phosphotransferase enzyme family protein-like protein [Lophium mytilinum]